jgi:hypothetical protein
MPHQTQADMFENSHCQVCKADWFQVGRKCRHCKIGEELEDLHPDRVTLHVISSFHSLLKSPSGATIFSKSRGADSACRLVEQRAKVFFELLQVEKRERTAAWRLWRATWIC